MQTLSQTESFSTIMHLPAVALVGSSSYITLQNWSVREIPIYEPKFRQHKVTDWGSTPHSFMDQVPKTFPQNGFALFLSDPSPIIGNACQ